MRTRAIVLATIVALCGATQAGAIGCNEWSQLSDDDKQYVVLDMIDAMVSGSAGRSYNVNRGRIERCLKRRARQIEYSFDDVCADSATASMGAIDALFKDFVWSCVN